ncbi:MAG TPA: hypothetical protein VMW89_19820 [Desulfatiglandales bacterium]|nr:hypothetical protein [Desulfatiglandales bacterium]
MPLRASGTAVAGTTKRSYLVGAIGAKPPYCFATNAFAAPHSQMATASLYPTATFHQSSKVLAPSGQSFRQAPQSQHSSG